MSEEEPNVEMQHRLVQAFASAKLRPSRGEGLAEFLRRQTHVYLQHQGLVGALPSSIPGLLPKVSVMYAYGNKLTDVSALSRLSELDMLYFQDNKLTSISQLGALTSLRRLDVDGNCIDCVSGFDNMRFLSVLHISRQTLSGEQALMFDNASLDGLSGSLATLRASSCRMNRVADLSQLRSLQVADFSRNNLSDPEDCLSFVSQALCLVDLDLRENPVSNTRKFLDQVITVGNSVQVLNGSSIKEETRMYLQQLAKRRLRIVKVCPGHKLPGTGAGEGSHGDCVEKAGVYHDMHSQSPCTQLQKSSRRSGGDRRTTVQEENMHVQSASIQCVGAGLHGYSCGKEDGIPVFGNRASGRQGCQLEEALDHLQASRQKSGLFQTARILGGKNLGENRSYGKVSATRVKAPSQG